MPSSINRFTICGRDKPTFNEDDSLDIYNPTESSGAGPRIGLAAFAVGGRQCRHSLACHTLATGAMLITLIFTFGPISGAHFNPAVTLADASQGGIGWSDVPTYLDAQVSGAFIGVAASHLMYGEALLQLSHHARAGGGQLFSEFIATFGLLCVIWGCARLRSDAVPVAVGLYITGPTGLPLPHPSPIRR